MQNKNIILFSSGVSEQNGMLQEIKKALENLGYRCAYWRDLFKHAKDPANIALLPSLIKKIPTFDYAILICEGHDRTIMLRDGREIEYHSMRDNVLFEIGLCSMALGLSRTILLTDPHVHLPEDLCGKNSSLAVKRVIYQQGDNRQICVKHIDEYIRNYDHELTPVVIGAASSSAEGYVNNFLLRTLEHIEEGVFLGDKKYNFRMENVFVHIVMPHIIEGKTAQLAAEELSIYEKAVVPAARSRSAVFRCRIAGEELHIYDFPTSIITSYNTAKMILDIDADDGEDQEAASRFTAKELKLFEATLKSLLTEKYVSRMIEGYYQDMSADERKQLTMKICELFRQRLIIEHGSLS